MAIMAIAVKMPRISTMAVKASRAKARGASSASSFFENMGTKAMLNAPSAKKRRNMLGSEKAMRKASATGPAPRKAAMRMSRTKPRTRLTIVHVPTVRNPATRRMGRISGRS